MIGWQLVFPHTPQPSPHPHFPLPCCCYLLFCNIYYCCWQHAILTVPYGSSPFMSFVACFQLPFALLCRLYCMCGVMVVVFFAPVWYFLCCLVSGRTDLDFTATWLAFSRRSWMVRWRRARSIQFAYNLLPPRERYIIFSPSITTYTVAVT